MNLRGRLTLPVGLAILMITEAVAPLAVASPDEVECPANVREK